MHEQRFANNIEPILGDGEATLDIGIPGAYWWNPEGSTPTCTAELNSHIVRWHPVQVIRSDVIAPVIEFEFGVLPS